MLGNFSYKNATKLYFGEDSLKYLNDELPKYGKNVVLIYGGGSIKKNGIYDSVIEILKANGKNVFEDAGVMPNPTVDKLREGVNIAKKQMRICFWQSAEALAVIMQRQFPYRCTAMMTLGISIIRDLKNPTAI